jgi:hypothetical protein
MGSPRVELAAVRGIRASQSSQSSEIPHWEITGKIPGESFAVLDFSKPGYQSKKLVDILFAFFFQYLVT